MAAVQKLMYLSDTSIAEEVPKTHLCLRLPVQCLQKVDYCSRRGRAGTSSQSGYFIPLLAAHAEEQQLEAVQRARGPTEQLDVSALGQVVYLFTRGAVQAARTGADVPHVALALATQADGLTCMPRSKVRKLLAIVLLQSETELEECAGSAMWHRSMHLW
jgi:hypothetical protein